MGCLLKRGDCVLIKTKKDLTGLRFGRLIVIEQGEDYVDDKGRKAARWVCQCDCGSEPFLVRGTQLNNGRTKSCGCLLTDILIDRNKNILNIINLNHTRNKKYNTYDLSGEYGIGYTTKGQEFWFDLEDYDKIKDFCWYYSKTGYLKTNRKKDDGTVSPILFHRFVMNATIDDLDVDHISHYPRKELKFDNRKSNLRFVTDSQNGMNQYTAINNTSGAKGVYWNKQYNNWFALITVNKKRIHLGSFKKFEDAVKARKEAEKKYYGEYNCEEII